MNAFNLKEKGILMGSLPDQWMSGKAKDITFCVTEDCNLRCKYCYMTGKNRKKKLSLDVGKQAIDFFLKNRDDFPQEAVIWNFIGGEPFLEIELIDQMTDYLKEQMYRLSHPWFDNYMLNFSSNGVLYGTPEVQRYIEKNRMHLSIGLSVDGNQIKHDLQRIHPDGRGSYADVIKNVPLWLEQFPNQGTKSTFAHDDLPYLKDSILSLWEVGIKNVAANVVFEDVWHEGDDRIFEQQLDELGEYVIANKLWREYSVRFFSPSIGYPLSEREKAMNFCGAGMMIAVDCEGKLYPCVRFYGMCLGHQKPLIIGDIYHGIDYNRLRPFYTLTLENQSPEQCWDCEVASGCALCTGANYDFADTATIYQRATFICKMHQANVRAKNRFWERLAKADADVARAFSSNATELPSEDRNSSGYLQLITSDRITPHCTYRNWRNGQAVMTAETFWQAVEFAEKKGFIPVILGEIDDTLRAPLPNPEDMLHISDQQDSNPEVQTLVVYDNQIEPIRSSGSICILLMNRENITKIAEYVKALSIAHQRINLILEEIEAWKSEEFEAYESELGALLPLAAEKYAAEQPFELNVLTDRLDCKELSDCEAGQKAFAVAPNGRIYLCPAFYFHDPEDFVGTLTDGPDVKNAHLLESENSPVCRECDAYQCRRCKFQNKMFTGEIHIPSRNQCVISHIERKKTLELQLLLEENAEIHVAEKLKPVDYLDPLENIIKDKPLLKLGNVW
jgi:radical SAM peptide maturase (CXXX-repeat target family)/CXXX repeat peptide maturase